jgi:transposase
MTLIPRSRRRSKKNLADEVAAIQAAHPDAAVELWTTDEHRIGLLPLIRRVWAPKGKRPIAPVQQRYEWLYVCGFVRPTTGETEWWLLPAISALAFGLVLAAFARDVGAGARKHILLVLDGAGWHTGEEVHVPEGVHLLFLPAYSPELQPAEHLWPLTNEPLANRRFESLAALEAVQAERCLTLQEQPDLVRQHTLFHWWPTTA